MEAKKVLKRGFTLIELLVVIAIIGVLSSIVLASLNTARNKGNNAAVKSNLANIRPQAEIYYDSATGGDGDYDGLCAETTVVNQINAAKSAAGISSVATITALGTAGAEGTATCHENDSAWAIEVPLKDPSTDFWCVDSTGASQQKTDPFAVNAVTCS